MGGPSIGGGGASNGGPSTEFYGRYFIDETQDPGVSTPARSTRRIGLFFNFILFGEFARFWKPD